MARVRTFLVAVVALTSIGITAAPAVAGIDTELARLGRPPVALAYEDRGVWVELLNRRLAEAGFHADTGTVFGRQTRHAVYAFQKVHGLETDGVFTPEMWDLIEATPALEFRTEANRVEVDLERQVLFVVENHRIRYIMPISSGSGGTFLGRDGRTVRARTPEGKFTFERSINGMRISYLGALYNPFYFRGGYAIHGSPSVPNHPASHGCVRVTNWDMDLLKQHFEIGQTVYVYGNLTPAPPGVTVQLVEPIEAA
jgi:lipoprotein-anchoring transpeptidase ErfK/SrfK